MESTRCVRPPGVLQSRSKAWRSPDWRDCMRIYRQCASVNAMFLKKIMAQGIQAMPPLERQLRGHSANRVSTAWNRQGLRRMNALGLPAYKRNTHADLYTSCCLDRSQMVRKSVQNPEE